MYLHRKLQVYYLTAVLGVVIALLGFGYNTWRLEISENNNNIRTAAFESFKALATLEQIIYARHYDQNEQDGSPQKSLGSGGFNQRSEQYSQRRGAY